MTTKVSFYKVQDAPKTGEYKPTEIDQRKKDADILLLQVNPKVVDSKVALKGRGIKPFGTVANRYRVTDKAWETMQDRYTCMTDF